MVKKFLKTQPIQTITKDGECKISISIQLDINLNDDGGVSVKAIASPEEKEDTLWAIPDFGSEKIKFGKETK